MHNQFFHLKWFISMMLILPLFLGAQPDVDLGKIKQSLICTCECNMTVAACEGSMSCNTSTNLTLEAKDLIKKGLNEKEILSIFVKRYGEQIMSAPSKTGFNLIAWILPFTIFIFTGFGIIIMLKKWTGSIHKNSVNNKKNNVNTNLKYEEQLDEALDSLD